jgi:hypothetical protein
MTTRFAAALKAKIMNFIQGILGPFIRINAWPLDFRSESSRKIAANKKYIK